MEKQVKDSEGIGTVLDAALLKETPRQTWGQLVVQATHKGENLQEVTIRRTIARRHDGVVGSSEPPATVL